MKIEFEYPSEPVMLPGNNQIKIPEKKQLNKAADLINNSKKPVILAGHGILLSGASREVIKLAETASVQ